MLTRIKATLLLLCTVSLCGTGILFLIVTAIARGTKVLAKNVLFASTIVLFVMTNLAISAPYRTQSESCRLRITDDTNFVYDPCTGLKWIRDIGKLAGKTLEGQKTAAALIYKNDKRHCRIVTAAELDVLISHHGPGSRNLFGLFTPVQTNSGGYVQSYLGRDNSGRMFGTYTWVHNYHEYSTMAGNHSQPVNLFSYNYPPDIAVSYVSAWGVCRPYIPPAPAFHWSTGLFRGGWFYRHP